METPDGGSNGAYAPATLTDRVIDSTAADAPKEKVAPKKTEKMEANVGTEPPQLKIAKTELVTAEAKKVEKRDSETGMEAPTPSVIAKEVSFGYQTKSQPKLLLMQNNDNISLTGKQTVETKESATEPQKPELSIASNMAEVPFKKNTLPKKEFTIGGQSELFVAPKKKEPLSIERRGGITVLPKKGKVSYAIEKQKDNDITFWAQPKSKNEVESEKLPKKPTDPNTEKEVDDFRKRLKGAGDNLKKLELLQDELKNKPDLKKWVSDESEEAVKDAKEAKGREGKYKKEEEEAKKEMYELMRRLKNTKDIEQLKSGIVTLLNYAQKRLTSVGDKFGLEEAEGFVKKMGDVYGDDVRRIAQKNAAGSFAHTVSLVQENIMEVWKRMTVILKPETLPMEVLSKATAGKKNKINREVTRKIQAVVKKEDAEIAVLRERLEEMEKKLKQQALDAKIKQHMRGKAEMNLSSKANGSSLYNLNDTSDVPEEDCDNGRRSTPYETPWKNKSRSRYARNANNYSRDDSPLSSVSYSPTLLEEFENSDFRLENYNESQIKSDKAFETLDKKGLLLFTVQGESCNSLASIEEMKDEIQEDDKEDMLPKLRKMGQQMLDYLNSDYWKNDVMWNKNFETHNKSVKEAIRRLLEYIEKKNKQTPVLQKSVTEKKLKTAKAGTKTRSRFVTDISTENGSRLTKNRKSMFDNQKSDSKGKSTGTYYQKIKKTKINYTGRKKDKTE